MVKAVLFGLLVLFYFQNIYAQENTRILQDFETDGCTMFINGPVNQPDLWLPCCYEHDLRYWFGGTKLDKHIADLELKSCVQKVAGNFWANLIYTGVVFGSYSPIKFKYVWGWGWDPKRSNDPLTESEIRYIMERLYALNLDPAYIEYFIQKYLIKQN